jgi:hypothetical protein
VDHGHVSVEPLAVVAKKVVKKKTTKGYIVKDM